MVNVVLFPAAPSVPFALLVDASAPPAFCAPTVYVSVPASWSAPNVRSINDPPPPPPPPDAVEADVSVAPPPPEPPPPIRITRTNLAHDCLVHVCAEPDVYLSTWI